MFRRFSWALAAATLCLAGAGERSYNISILQDSTVNGKPLKAGDYQVKLRDDHTAILKRGRRSMEVPARTANALSQFASTELKFTTSNDLEEIDVGGTNTKIVFEVAGSEASTLN